MRHVEGLQCVSRRGIGRRRDKKVAEETKEIDLGFYDYSKGSRERLDTVQNRTTQQEHSLMTRAQPCASVYVWLWTGPGTI